MRYIIGTIFCLLCHCAFTTPSVNQALQDHQPIFDVKDANKKFDKLNIQLSTQNLELKTLSDAVKTLNQLILGATECIDTNEKRLSTIDEQIQQTAILKTGPHVTTSPSIIDTNKSDADLLYLNTERKKIASQLSQCRLFSIRGKEAVDAYNLAITKLKHVETFTRGLTLWATFKTLQEIPSNQPFIATHWSPTPSLSSPIKIIGVIAMSFMAASVFLLWIRQRRWIKHHLRIRTLQWSNLIMLTFFLSLSLFSVEIKWDTLNETLDNVMPLHLTIALSIYSFGLLMIAFIFNFKRARAFFYWYSLDSFYFKALTMFLFSFYSVAFLANFFAKHMAIQSPLWLFGKSIFLLAVLTSALVFVYYFCHAHRHIPFVKHHHRLIKRLSLGLFVTSGILDIWGYHTLAMHLTFAYISTFAVAFCGWLLDQAINKFYIACTHLGSWHDKMNDVFGYKSSQTPPEILILKLTLQISVFILAIYLIIHSWGYANTYVEDAYRQFFFGFQFSTFTFYPARIITGIIVFCFLYLLCRALSRALTRQERYEDEEETQVALASIFSYLGFAFSLIVGLLVGGFNFTGLAIIAGALSVGIGLGLQSIVNNFVSGLILLIEKPVKPGDRIRVDAIEGIVKKIRVRSTQITTSAREDVIIPNSDLITRPVTNFMYSDKYLSIGSTVNVAFNTDPNLVKDLLLKATQKHDDIVKTSRSKPTVVFHSFGDNGLVFQLWFVIKDGNRKSEIKSHIHFEIERLFREHHIQFALPQRNIHVKMDEIKTIAEDK